MRSVINRGGVLRLSLVGVCLVVTGVFPASSQAIITPKFYMLQGTIGDLPAGSSISNAVALVAVGASSGFAATDDAEPLTLTNNPDGTTNYRSPVFSAPQLSSVADTILGTYNDASGATHLMILAQNAALSAVTSPFLVPGDSFTTDFPGGSFTEPALLDGLPGVTGPESGAGVASAFTNFLDSRPVTLASTFQGDAYGGAAVVYSGMTEVATFTGSTVPEPGTLGLLGCAAAYLLARRPNRA